MSLFDSSQPAITVLTDVPFPATVYSGPGIEINKQDPTAWLIQLDYPDLPEETVLTPQSQYYLALLDTSDGGYEKVRLDTFANTLQKIDQRTGVGDVSYAVAVTDRYVALTATLTAVRTLTLPPASTVAAGHAITFQDEVAGITRSNYWSLAPSGSDTIDGRNAPRVITRPRGALTLWCDGVGKWSVNRLTDAPAPTASFALSPDDTSLGFGTLTTPVTATLPLAANTSAGKVITVCDAHGSCTATNSITVARSGSDLINGVPAPAVATLQANYSYIVLQSDGVSNWTVIGGGTNPAASSITASQISDSTAIGRAVITAPSTGAAQTAIGAGVTGSAVFVAATTAAAQAAIGATSLGSSLITAANPAAAQSALGLGNMATQNSSNVNVTGGTIAGVQLNNDIITGGTIDNTPIGNTNQAAGHFTTLGASAAAITGGTIDGTAIGGTTPAAGKFTSLSATSVDNTPIGNTTPAAGHFTSLSCTATATFTSVMATGYAARSGVSGAFSGNYFNINWTAGRAALWIDSTNLGNIALTSDVSGYLPLAGGTVTGAITGNNGCYFNYSGYGLYSSTPVYCASTLQVISTTTLGYVHAGPINAVGQAGALVVENNAGGVLQCYMSAAAGGGNCSVFHVDSTAQTLCAFQYQGGFPGSITTNGSNISYNGSSDLRLKKNVRDIADDLDVGELIDAVRPVAFEWKDGHPDTEHGFVAQELIEVVPNAVTATDDGKRALGGVPWGVDASKLIPLLVAEIQQLRKRVAQLEGG